MIKIEMGTMRKEKTRRNPKKKSAQINQKTIVE